MRRTSNGEHSRGLSGLTGSGVTGCSERDCPIPSSPVAMAQGRCNATEAIRRQFSRAARALQCAALCYLELSMACDGRHDSRTSGCSDVVLWGALPGRGHRNSEPPDYASDNWAGVYNRKSPHTIPPYTLIPREVAYLDVVRGRGCSGHLQSPTCLTSS